MELSEMTCIAKSAQHNQPPFPRRSNCYEDKLHLTATARFLCSSVHLSFGSSIVFTLPGSETRVSPTGGGSSQGELSYHSSPLCRTTLATANGIQSPIILSSKSRLRPIPATIRFNSSLAERSSKCRFSNIITSRPPIHPTIWS
jgi:hypothetical protein